MNAMALRYLSPRTVYRFGTWPNNGPVRLPVNTVRLSGSQTTSESVVSPPGVEYSSKRRSPRVNVWLSMKVVVTTGSGGWYERSTFVRSPLQSLCVRVV